jgi:Fe-S-cluster containining protein
VRLEAREISQLASFMGMSEFDFIQKYTRLRENRRGLALLEKTNGECIFLDGRDCSVQPVKPQQCRDFPNRWNFPGFEKVCKAVPREASDAEYQRLLSGVGGT